MKLIYEILDIYGIMELICEMIGLILQSIKLIYQSTIFCCLTIISHTPFSVLTINSYTNTEIANKKCHRIGDSTQQQYHNRI